MLRLGSGQHPFRYRRVRSHQTTTPDPQSVPSANLLSGYAASDRRPRCLATCRRLADPQEWCRSPTILSNRTPSELKLLCRLNPDSIVNRGPNALLASEVALGSLNLIRAQAETGSVRVLLPPHDIAGHTSCEGHAVPTCRFPLGLHIHGRYATQLFLLGCHPKPFRSCSLCERAFRI
jgi:hypothetical protein